MHLPHLLRYARGKNCYTVAFCSFPVCFYNYILKFYWVAVVCQLEWRQGGMRTKICEDMYIALIQEIILVTIFQPSILHHCLNLKDPVFKYPFNNMLLNSGTSFRNLSWIMHCNLSQIQQHAAYFSSCLYRSTVWITSNTLWKIAQLHIIPTAGH